MTSFNPFSSVQYGATPYTYFVSAGTLPTGITIDPSTGLVSGTPTTLQSAANVTFSVRDVNNVVATTTSTVSFAVVVPAPYIVQYLVVGGGGGGAKANSNQGAGGGGGAGGLLQGNVTFTPSTIYSITVGSGGPGGTMPYPGGSTAQPGQPSQLSGTPITTISALGGGRGSAGPNSCNYATPGFGSGGGSYFGCQGYAANFPSPAPLFYTPTGAQGYPGTSGRFATNKAAGGGGAGGTTPSSCVTLAGGPGYVWPYTGVTYARGGSGGPSYCYALQVPTGPGIGYGGTGGNFYGPLPPSPSPLILGNAGYGGAVVLAIPNAGYPGSAPPAATVSTPPAAPGMTVLTFTAPGTFTA
jgi:hypothetical protein